MASSVLCELLSMRVRHSCKHLRTPCKKKKWLVKFTSESLARDSNSVDLMPEESYFRAFSERILIERSNFIALKPATNRIGQHFWLTFWPAMLANIYLHVGQHLILALFLYPPTLLANICRNLLTLKVFWIPFKRLNVFFTLLKNTWRKQVNGRIVMLPFLIWEDLCHSKPLAVLANNVVLLAAALAFTGLQMHSDIQSNVEVATKTDNDKGRIFCIFLIHHDRCTHVGSDST